MPPPNPREGIVFAGLMPHAPVLVTGVRRAQHHVHVSRTVRAMADVARRAVAALPDTIVVISPHSPRRPGAYGIWQTPMLHGSFDQFGDSEHRIDLRLDQEFADRLANEARALGVQTWRIVRGPLDHGATVPLSYLMSAGWASPTVIVGLSEPHDSGLDEFGHALLATATALGRRVAVIASGDMSHRLSLNAPSGFHEDGARFDQRFIDLLRGGAMSELRRFDTKLVGNAAEDVLDCTRIVLAMSDYHAPENAVLSYEAPFGVGYGVAVFTDHPPVDPRATAAAAEPTLLSHRADLPIVARSAVAAHLNAGEGGPPFAAAGDLLRPRGVFVTLRMANGALRGCGGAPMPVAGNLVDETWRAATVAAFEDSRFPTLRAEELPQVRFSVSILGPLESVRAATELDPELYGIFIRARNGRKSVLLPGIKGVNSAEDQLRIARHKAGLGTVDSIEIKRFTAQTFYEPPPVDRDA